VTDSRSGTTSTNNSDSTIQTCLSGQYWYVSPGSTAGYCKTSDTQTNQREQMWNSLGFRSWVRNDADAARIESLKQACANVSNGANVWMSEAGTSTSVNFGMPDPEKCKTYGPQQRQNQCPAGQEWVAQDIVSKLIL